MTDFVSIRTVTARWFGLLVIGVLLSGVPWSCGQNDPQGAASPAATAARPGFCALAFSTLKPVFGNVPENWCKLPADEKIAIFPDSSDPARRYFLMGVGLYRLQATYGNQRIGLMFRPQGNRVEIFTSDNFPECCTGSSFCKLQSGNTLLDYENQRQMGFSFEATPQPDGSVKACILLNRNNAYGVEVRKVTE